jgi:hypothetical protein
VPSARTNWAVIGWAQALHEFGPEPCEVVLDGGRPPLIVLGLSMVCDSSERAEPGRMRLPDGVLGRELELGARYPGDGDGLRLFPFGWSDAGGLRGEPGGVRAW